MEKVCESCLYLNWSSNYDYFAPTAECILFNSDDLGLEDNYYYTDNELYTNHVCDYYVDREEFLLNVKAINFSREGEEK